MKGTELIDAMKSYVQMASGIVEATAAKAMETAQGLVAQGMESGTKGPEQVASQVTLIAEDLMAQSKTNRELILGLVRTEVERIVGRVGFVREEELAAVRAHLDRLEAQVRGAIGQLADVPVISAVAEAAETAADSASTVAHQAETLAETTAMRKLHVEHEAPAETHVPAKKTVVRSPGAKKTAAKKAPAKKTAAKKAPAKKAPAKKTAAKKTAAKKTPAKKTAAKKTAAKKTSS